MVEALRSKRRRVYSFDPNTTTYTTFSHKYLSYLLPALLRVANGNRSALIEKIVRLEVDKALVSSTDEFKWSRALKQDLEEGNKSNKLHISSQSRSEIDHFRILKRFGCLQAFTAIPRPIVIVEATRLRKAGQKSMKKRMTRGEGELACRIRILRRILPGGSEMSVFELLSELQSYVVCLQLQVGVLRSLVDAQ